MPDHVPLGSGCLTWPPPKRKPPPRCRPQRGQRRQPRVQPWVPNPTSRRAPTGRTEWRKAGGAMTSVRSVRPVGAGGNMGRHPRVSLRSTLGFHRAPRCGGRQMGDRGSSHTIHLSDRFAFYPAGVGIRPRPQIDRIIFAGIRMSEVGAPPLVRPASAHGGPLGLRTGRLDSDGHIGLAGGSLAAVASTAIHLDGRSLLVQSVYPG